jgi:hypothetical protein
MEGLTMADFLGNIWFAALIGLAGYCLGSVWPLHRLFKK